MIRPPAWRAANESGRPIDLGDQHDPRSPGRTAKDASSKVVLAEHGDELALDVARRRQAVDRFDLEDVIAPVATPAR